MNGSVSRVWLLAAVAIACFCASAARAQSESFTNDTGITVSGAGETRSKPDQIDIDLSLSARAELTDDAMAKYRDAKKRAIEAFQALKMKNLTIQEHGLTIVPGNSAEAMQAAMNGQAMPANAKSQIEVSSVLTLRLTDIKDTPIDESMKTIGKLIDVAKDSGAGIGPSPAEITMAYRYGRTPSEAVVKFVLHDFTAVREAAYAKAAEDAHSRAERLAKLHNVKLGPIAAVQEMGVTSDDENHTQQQPWETDTMASHAGQESQITSPIFSDINFRVKLLVRYTILKPNVNTTATDAAANPTTAAKK